MGEESLLAGDWFDKGARDLKRVGILLAADDEEGAGFHLQQAAEKYLKGYLLTREWRLERTHDLLYLVDEALTHDERFQEFREACRLVTQYYVEQRYPFPSSPTPPRETLEGAIACITEMVALILSETTP